MGVHGDGRPPEGVAQHNIGGFAPDAGQSHERLPPLGHDAVEALDQPARQADEPLGAGALHAQRSQQRLEIVGVGGRQRTGVGAEREELGGDGVDSGIGGLSGQDRGHQELEGAVVVQGAVRPGIDGGELIIDGAGAQSGGGA